MEASLFLLTNPFPHSSHAPSPQPFIFKRKLTLSIAKLLLCIKPIATSPQSSQIKPSSTSRTSFNGSFPLLGQNPLAHSSSPPSPRLTRFNGKLRNGIAKLCTCIASIAASPCAQAKPLLLFPQRGIFEKPLPCKLILPLLAHLSPMPRVAIAQSKLFSFSLPSFYKLLPTSKVIPSSPTSSQKKKKEAKNLYINKEEKKPSSSKNFLPSSSINLFPLHQPSQSNQLLQGKFKEGNAPSLPPLIALFQVCEACYASSCLLLNVSFRQGKWKKCPKR